MAIEDPAEFLNEYLEWKAMQSAKDTSPDAFMIDRAKDQAFDVLTSIQGVITQVESEELYAEEALAYIRALLNDI